MNEHDPMPPEERARLQEIADLGLVSAEADGVLEDLTEEAAGALGLPTALVSVVTDSAQYFAASHGLAGWLAEARGTPKEWSFCRHAVGDKTTFAVENAVLDERVLDSPLVTEDGIGCYLGVPLVTSRGHAVGTLCVVGPAARTFSDEDHDTLQKLAARAVARIEARRRPPDR